MPIATSDGDGLDGLAEAHLVADQHAAVSLECEPAAANVRQSPRCDGGLLSNEHVLHALTLKRQQALFQLARQHRQRGFGRWRALRAENHRANDLRQLADGEHRNLFQEAKSESASSTITASPLRISAHISAYRSQDRYPHTYLGERCYQRIVVLERERAARLFDRHVGDGLADTENGLVGDLVGGESARRVRRVRLPPINEARAQHWCALINEHQRERAPQYLFLEHMENSTTAGTVLEQSTCWPHTSCMPPNGARVLVAIGRGAGDTTGACSDAVAAGRPLQGEGKAGAAAGVVTWLAWYSGVDVTGVVAWKGLWYGDGVPLDRAVLSMV